MNELKVFTSETFGQVRTVVKGNEPWFVAADVCRALEIGNTAMALSRLDDDEKDVEIIYTAGGNQKVSIVNESGLYGLVLGSRKPEAKEFKRWITHEVIPSVRKYGMYSIEDLIADPDFVIKALHRLEDARSDCEVLHYSTKMNASIISVYEKKQPQFAMFDGNNADALDREHPPVSHAGYVYILECGGCLKIGSTQNPRKRIKRLKMLFNNYQGQEIGRVAISILHTNYQYNERLLHLVLSERRIPNTEMFRANFDDLIRRIESGDIALRYENKIYENYKRGKNLLQGIQGFAFHGTVGCSSTNS